MSNLIKLGAKLPGDPEINGLDSRVDHFIRDDTPALCLAWVSTKHVTRNIETGDEVPTVELRRIEPIAIADKAPQEIITLAAELYEKRTGRDPLPIAALVVPAGDVGELEDDGAVGGDVVDFLGRRPDAGADAFVYDDEDQGDE